MPRTNQCVDCGVAIWPGGLRCKSCAKKGALNNRYGVTFSTETRSKIAAQMSKPNGRNGDKHPGWKGDSASKKQGRLRAERMYPSQPCQMCGSEHSERHHVDGNTLNNDHENVVHLCRRHHRQIHPGRGNAPLREWYWCPDCQRVMHISELISGCPSCGETMIPVVLER